MNNGYNADDDRLLGVGSEEAYANFEPESLKPDDAEEYYDLPPAIRSRSLIWAVIAFAAGILSIALCPLYYVGYVFATAAIVTALISRHNLGFFERYTIMGIVFGIIGFVFNTFTLVAGIVGLFA